MMNGNQRFIVHFTPKYYEIHSHPFVAYFLFLMYNKQFFFCFFFGRRNKIWTHWTKIYWKKKKYFTNLWLCSVCNLVCIILVRLATWWVFENTYEEAKNITRNQFLLFAKIKKKNKIHKTKKIKSFVSIIFFPLINLYIL